MTARFISDATCAALAAISDAGLKVSVLAGAALDIEVDGAEREMIRAMEEVEAQLRILRSEGAVVQRALAELHAQRPLRAQLSASLKAGRTGDPRHDFGGFA